MAVLAECPYCHRKQATKNKLCVKCGQNLDKAKSSKKVSYWIHYRTPDKKQKWELIGKSVKEACDADGKRRVEKRETPHVFDQRAETRMTFNQLTEWYIDLEKVKALASYDIIKINLNKFNRVFGDRIISSIIPADLENYQMQRKAAGAADATIDHEIGKAKTMINKAFDNELVSGNTLRKFKGVGKMLKKGSDVRDRILSTDEFDAIMAHLPRLVPKAGLEPARA
jgi:hypothetical protein